MHEPASHAPVVTASVRFDGSPFRRMVRGLIPALVVLLALATFGVTPEAQKGKVENERWGFKMSIPKGFGEVPLKVDEQWLGAKFLSEKEYSYYDKDTGWSWEFRPEVLVIGFLKNQPKEKEAGDIDEDDLKKGIKFSLQSPFKDYEDYLDRTYTGGGFYISSRETTKHKDMEVTQIEAKVEKLSTTGPKRIITWVYHTKDVDYAVQFEVLEDSYKKLKKTIKSCHKSFKVIERKGGLTSQRVGGWITFKMMDEGTPEDRRKARMESELQHRQRALDSLPDGWDSDDRGSCFVLTHTKKNFTDKVVEQVEGVMAWLDETFPFIGKDQYVRTPIVRICESRDEYNSFVKGGDGSWSTGLEIVTYLDRDGWSDWQFETIGTKTLQHWFGERDRELYWAIPAWLRQGLDGFVADMEFSGRRMKIRPDGWDKSQLRDRISSGQANEPKKLIQMDMQSFYAAGGFWECNALVRYLLDGKGSKSKKTAKVVEEYMLNLQRFLHDKDAKEEKEKEAKEAVAEGGEPVDAGPYGEKAPETEEEEEEQFKRRRERFKKEEQTLLQELFTRTFGHWSRDDWEDFADDYFKAFG